MGNSRSSRPNWFYATAITYVAVQMYVINAIGMAQIVGLDVIIVIEALIFVTYILARQRQKVKLLKPHPTVE